MKQEIKKRILDDKILFIRLQFTDIFGTLKSVELPVSQVDSVLDNEVMFDGSSIEGFVRIMEADMLLYPDLNTYMIINPDDEIKIVRFICDIYKTDRKPFVGDPRTNLKRVIAEMNELGFANFNIGLEPEFYLFKLDAQKNVSLVTNDQHSYFDMPPIEQVDQCIRAMALQLEKIGFIIETMHHEVGPGQFEVNFKYDNVLESCDHLQTFKSIVKSTAHQFDLYASFMPKPFANQAGNGMHANCSLADSAGNNVFYDENDEIQLSQTARHFIAGVMKHSAALCAVTNPTINSYKRLTPGYEAPCYNGWSTENRSTFIRIPASRKQATRVEIRSVDCSANPYLALAAILQAGLDGIKNKLAPQDPLYINVFALTSKERKAMNISNLPTSLSDSLKALQEDETIQAALGDHLFEKFIEAKKREWDSFRRHVSSWEIDEYLLKI